MTTAEFNAAIQLSKDSNWFENKKIPITFKFCDTKLEFESLNTLYEFATNQVQNWNQLKNQLPINYLQQFSGPYNRLKNGLENFAKNCRGEVGSTLDHLFQQNVAHQLKDIPTTFLFDSPEVLFLTAVYLDNPKKFDGAVNYLLEQNSNVDNYLLLTGAILAYEFRHKDKATLTERRNYEFKSIENIKNELITTISEAKKDTSDLILSTKQRIETDNENTRVKYKEYTDDFDSFRKKIEEEYNTWFEQTQTGFKNFDSSSSARVQEIISLYGEQMKLKKPAEYWKMRATELKNEGWKSLYWLIGLITITCGTLYCLLWRTPSGMLLSFTTDKPGALKWSIVYITFISFMAFCIRAISKVMFSSFHLSRDAEEREQLTYVYLAMVKDASVDEKDRTLIMQSLFSRADTGLLKEDSSPTMPGGILEKITKH